MESDRLILTLSVVIVIITVLALGKPTITGYVPTQTHSQNLNIDVGQSQRFTLMAPNGTLKLSSFSVSGTVTGSGLAKVYLSDGNNNWLVFTNAKRKTSPMKHITGLATSELLLQPGEKLEEATTIPAGLIAEEGNFENECIETCILDEKLSPIEKIYLDAIVQPGTNLHISEITFTASE